MSDLGQRMVRYRAKHNLSQEELATMCKLSIMTICNVETNQREPTRLTVAKIEQVINEQQEE